MNLFDKIKQEYIDKYLNQTISIHNTLFVDEDIEDVIKYKQIFYYPKELKDYDGLKYLNIEYTIDDKEFITVISIV